MHFLQNLSNLDPFNNDSSTTLLSAVKCIKLNQEYLIRLPVMLYTVCDEIFERDTSTKTFDTSSRNLRHLCCILFDTRLYGNPPRSLLTNVTLFTHTVFFKYFPILVGTSRKIMNRALQKPTIYNAAALECLRFLFKYLWEYIERQNNSLRPRLDELYYLEKNVDIPFKKKQLLFVRELMDKCGLIPYHHTFINKEWSYSDETSYIAFEAKARSKYFSFEHNEEFFAQFLLKFLEGNHWDLENFQLQSFLELVDNTFSYLFIKIDRNKLRLIQLLHGLKVNNALQLIRHEQGVIAQMLRYHRMSDCFNLVEILICSILRYSLSQDQILIIRNSLVFWFVSNDRKMAVDQILHLVSDEFFNPHILNELVNIHDMFCFGLKHTNFWVTVIPKLLERRNDWNADDALKLFFMKFQPFMSLMNCSISLN